MGIINGQIDYSASKAGQPASIKYNTDAGDGANTMQGNVAVPTVNLSGVQNVAGTNTASQVQGFGTTNWNVDRNQTVQGQVSNIIAADSPLMQQAATGAKQAAAQRGLVNSSMGVQAGQAALYQAAMPMAQQDAQTYAGAARENANVANAAAQFGASARNDAIKMDAQSQFTADQNRADMQFKAAGAEADYANKTALQLIDQQTRGQIMNIEAKYKTQMQSSQSMAETYKSMIDRVTAIMTDKDMNADSKQVSINNLTQLYNNALQAQKMISGLDVGPLLQPGELVGTNNKKASGITPISFGGG